MKGIIRSAAVISTLVLFGCATTPQKSTMDDLASSRKQIDQIRGQIDRSVYSLENLARAPAAEIKVAQKQYSTDVQSLRKMSDNLDDSARSMRQRRIDYLTEWERAQQSVESPELKRASEQRRKQVVQNLTALEAALHNANQGIAPLVADLEDIERVTANDPTAAGIAAVKKSGIVQAAQKHAATANSRLDLAASRYDKTLASLSPQSGTRPVAAASAPAAGAVGAAGSSATTLPSSTMPSFSQADRNANGAVEPDEASQIQGLDFKAADGDKDGKLSESEYEAARKSQAVTGGAAPSAR